jgi:hypothetical protein
MSAGLRDGAFLYVRRGNDVSGPFARRLVLQRLALGRIRPDDELSGDGVSWEPAEGFIEEAGPPLGGTPPEEPGMQDWTEERRQAWLRWIDERSGYERRTGPPPPEAPARGPDRRDTRDGRRQALFGPSGSESRPGWVAPLAAVLVLVAVIAFMRWWLPSSAPRVPALAGPDAVRAQ